VEKEYDGEVRTGPVEMGSHDDIFFYGDEQLLDGGVRGAGPPGGTRVKEGENDVGAVQGGIINFLKVDHVQAPFSGGFAAL
jgi:hypothetical protein